jgi:hypothetical protein
MPATVWKQATAVSQVTTVRPATNNIKDDSNIMTAHNSRTSQYSMDAIKSRDACKTVKLATAWREANSSRDNRNITKSTAEGRPATTRMSEIVETTNNSTSISRDS